MYHKLAGLAVLGAGLLASLATAQGSLTTTFTSNNTGAQGWGYYFLVNVKNPKGLKITSMDVNCSSTGPVQIETYVALQHWRGNETNKYRWNRVSVGSGTGKGTNNPTPINITDIYLAPGLYGMFIHFVKGTPRDTKLTTTPSRNHANKVVGLQLGAASQTPFGGIFKSPHVWSGKIYYDRDDKSGRGVAGYGCPLFKQPALSLSAEPILTASPWFFITNMTTLANGPGLILLSLNPAYADLTGFSMPGCLAYIQLPELLAIPFTNQNGSGGFHFPPIPNDNRLVGLIVYAQSFNVDRLATPFGLAASNGLFFRPGYK